MLVMESAVLRSSHVSRRSPFSDTVYGGNGKPLGMTVLPSALGMKTGVTPTAPVTAFMLYTRRSLAKPAGSVKTLIATASCTANRSVSYIQHKLYHASFGSYHSHFY
jgi:hypothetical protein